MSLRSWIAKISRRQHWESKGQGSNAQTGKEKRRGVIGASDSIGRVLKTFSCFGAFSGHQGKTEGGNKGK